MKPVITVEEEGEKKGVGLKVFGVCLFITGSLSTMLCWRGGLPVSPFHPIAMAVGIAFIIAGTIRGSA